MSNDSLGVPTSPANEKQVSLYVTDAIRIKVENASLSTGLKKSDVMRLAIDRGVDVLIKQLETEETAP
jgi:hypothetical protein